MTWLRLQWRGALVALAAWAGLAAAQSPMAPQGSPYLPAAPMPAPMSLPPVPAQPIPSLPSITSVPGAPSASLPKPLPTAPATAVPATPERIVTVHENGKSIRCRIIQTWQLADGSTAHQLQALDTGELITILDDPGTPSPSGRALSKRIFHWGQANRTPPPGSPVPPLPRELMVDSGVVVTRDINPPPPGGMVVGASGVTAVPSSPYAQGHSLPAVSGNVPCDCAPGTIVSGSCPAPACVPNGNVVVMDGCAGMGTAKIVPPPQPTVFSKLQNWFSMKSAPPAGTDAVIAAAPAPKASEKMVTRAPEKSLSIATPSSAQPARPERVAALATPDTVHSAVKNGGGVTESSAKPLIGVATPAPAGTDLANAKSSGAPVHVSSAKSGENTDVFATPEKFMPSNEKLKAKNVAVTPAKAAAATTTGAPTLPPGAGSVMAARNGLNGPVAYVPIQPMVMPKPWRPPVPPDPKVPEAPQLNTFVNAFSPPNPPGGQNGSQFQGPMMPYPPMMAYGPNRGMVPPYAMMNPYAPAPYAMMNPQGMPYGYYPMMPPWATAMNSQRSYQGPLPPDPFGTNNPNMLQQVGYMQPMMAYPPMMQAPFTAMPAPQAAPQIVPAAATQAATTPAAPPQTMAAQTMAAQTMAAQTMAAQTMAAQLGQLVDLLHDSPYPAQRELAANYLAGCDWRANPQVAAALIDAAKQDPAATVRAGCIANLMRMNVANEAYRWVLDEMRTDADPRVREAVEEAIVRLSQVQTAVRTN